MPNPQPFTLTRNYSYLAKKLLTDDVEIYTVEGYSTREETKKVTALWDTGATSSAISWRLYKGMNLIHRDFRPVNSVHSTRWDPILYISIGLPAQNGVKKIEKVMVTVCNLIKGIDLIIGMDIIQYGDFAISNSGGKTLFSFTIPPTE